MKGGIEGAAIAEERRGLQVNAAGGGVRGDPAGFGGGIAKGVEVRVETDFDSGGLGPAELVAISRAWRSAAARTAPSRSG